MPFYSYTSDGGVTVERWYNMGDAPASFTSDETTFKKDVIADFKGRAVRTQLCWPMVSEAMGVTENAIADAKRDLHTAGIPTDFTPDGGLILDSAQHRKKVMKHLGYYDKQGY